MNVTEDKIISELAQRIAREIQNRVPEAQTVNIEFDFGSVELEITMRTRLKWWA